MNKEELLQIQVCHYLSAQYPDVIYTSDSSGVKLTPGLAAKMARMRSERGIPDLLILEPKGEFCGLMLELKVESPYNLNGSLRKMKRVVRSRSLIIEEYDHHQEQQDILNRLTKKGYKACFSVGFDESKKIIDEYMHL